MKELIKFINICFITLGIIMCIIYLIVGSLTFPTLLVVITWGMLHELTYH